MKSTSKAGGKRGLWPAAGLAASAVTVVLLVAGCGVVHVHFGSAASSASPAATGEYLAYAQCMRAHGIAGFPSPRPSPSGNAIISVHVNGGPDSPVARANAACAHLLPASSTGAGVASAPLSFLGTKGRAR